MPPKPNISVRTCLRTVADPFFAKAQGMLEKEPVILWGEVLSVSQGDHLTFLTLLDSTEDDKVLEVRLPRNAAAAVG